MNDILGNNISKLIIDFWSKYYFEQFIKQR